MIKIEKHSKYATVSYSIVCLPHVFLTDTFPQLFTELVALVAYAGIPGRLMQCPAPQMSGFTVHSLIS